MKLSLCIWRGPSSAAAVCGAYLLVECLVYISVLAIVMGLGGRAFYESLNRSRDLSRSSADIVRTLRAGEKWRADVRAATGRPEIKRANDFAALEIPQAGGTVVYFFGEGRVWRKADLQAPEVEFLVGVARSTMGARLGQKVVSWVWEVELVTKKKAERVRPLFSFQAVAPVASKP